MLATKEINHFVGEKIALIIVDDPHGSISMAGASHLTDAAFYAAYFNALPDKVPAERWTILRGAILDPKNLPYHLELASAPVLPKIHPQLDPVYQNNNILVYRSKSLVRDRNQALFHASEYLLSRALVCP